eukprot:m.76738 g.76738  ORF g.76738 m.76738 type:complete len:941 (+) comp14039_c2_seq1:94-2916(+)
MYTTVISGEQACWLLQKMIFFCHQYVIYARALKFHLVQQPTDAKRHERLFAEFSQKPRVALKNVETNHIYLQKLSAFDEIAGVLVLEVFARGHLVFVQLHVMHGPGFESMALRTQTRSWRLGVLPPAQFSAEAARMCDMIHVNSFAYDFNTRIIEDIFRSELTVPRTLRLGAAVDNLIDFHLIPPRKAVNLLERQHLHLLEVVKYGHVSRINQKLPQIIPTNSPLGQFGHKYHDDLLNMEVAELLQNEELTHALRQLHVNMRDLFAHFCKQPSVFGYSTFLQVNGDNIMYMRRDDPAAKNSVGDAFLFFHSSAIEKPHPMSVKYYFLGTESPQVRAERHLLRVRSLPWNRAKNDTWLPFQALQASSRVMIAETMASVYRDHWKHKIWEKLNRFALSPKPVSPCPPLPPLAPSAVAQNRLSRFWRILKPRSPVPTQFGTNAMRSERTRARESMSSEAGQHAAISPQRSLLSSEPGRHSPGLETRQPLQPAAKGFLATIGSMGQQAAQRDRSAERVQRSSAQMMRGRWKSTSGAEEPFTTTTSTTSLTSLSGAITDKQEVTRAIDRPSPQSPPTGQKNVNSEGFDTDVQRSLRTTGQEEGVQQGEQHPAIAAAEVNNDDSEETVLPAFDDSDEEAEMATQRQATSEAATASSDRADDREKQRGLNEMPTEETTITTTARAVSIDNTSTEDNHVPRQPTPLLPESEEAYGSDTDEEGDANLPYVFNIDVLQPSPASKLSSTRVSVSDEDGSALTLAHQPGRVASLLSTTGSAEDLGADILPPRPRAFSGRSLIPFLSGEFALNDLVLDCLELCKGIAINKIDASILPLVEAVRFDTLCRIVLEDQNHRSLLVRIRDREPEGRHLILFNKTEEFHYCALYVAEHGSDGHIDVQVLLARPQTNQLRPPPQGELVYGDVSPDVAQLAREFAQTTISWLLAAVGRDL